MTALKPERLAAIQERFVKRGSTYHAVEEFIKRYKGTPNDAIPRLRLALELARASKGREIPAHSASLIRVPSNRKIFDVELPAEDFNPEPYTIRILTDAAVTCVITVLPPEFRKDIQARAKHRELRRIVDADITEPGTPVEKVVLPPPVEVRSSLGDALRKAMSR